MTLRRARAGNGPADTEEAAVNYVVPAISYAITSPRGSGPRADVARSLRAQKYRERWGLPTPPLAHPNNRPNARASNAGVLAQPPQRR